MSRIAAPAGRAELLGCPVDRLDMGQTVRRCLEQVEQRRYGQHLCINAAKLVAMHEDPSLMAVARDCSLVSADGQSVVWASRLLGLGLPERVAGIDLMGELFAAAERDGHSVYVLGAQAEALRTAMARLRERHPRLAVAGSRDGFFSTAEEAEVAAGVRASGADMLFVAMSSPRKERFLAEHGEAMGVPFVMGVGGSIDVLAGHTRRAPRAWQKTGMEWLYRLLQEPRRLAPRYARTNLRFLGLVAREALAWPRAAAQRRLCGQPPSSSE